MKTLTIRDFRTRPQQARQELSEAGEAVLTLHGEPVAVMIAVDGGLEETMGLVERVRAQRVVRDLRAQARTAGTDRLSMREIDRLIGEVRRSRGRKPR